MLKRHWSLLSAVAVVLSCQIEATATQELTAAEVIRKSVEARGGQESWDALQTIELSGFYSAFSQKHPFILRRKRPNLYRFDFKYTGFDVTFGYDGQTAWWINRTMFSEVDWAVEAPLVRARAIEEDAEFGGALLDFAEKGHRVELTGKVDLDGEETYELVVLLGTGSVEKWYLDVASFLPVARISTAPYLQAEREQQAYFFDYREEGEILIPHRIDIELDFNYELLEIEEVKINIDIDDRLFRLAPPSGMEKLRTLVGDWDVKVIGCRPIPAMPVMEEEFTSNIRASFHGSLLEEEFSYIAFGFPRHVKRVRTYDRFRDVFRITYFDDLTSHMNVLEGRFENGRLVATNLDTGTAWEARGQIFHTRELTYDIEVERFKVDWEVSTDCGRTWIPREKFVYTRSTNANP